MCPRGRESHGSRAVRPGWPIMNINGLLVSLIGKVARGNTAAKFTMVLTQPCAPGFVGCCFYFWEDCLVFSSRDLGKSSFCLSTGAMFALAICGGLQTGWYCCGISSIPKKCMHVKGFLLISWHAGEWKLVQPLAL